LNEEGKAYRVSGIWADITDRKRAQEDLQKALDQIKRLKDQLYEENVLLREEIDKVSMFEEIVGESRALQMVLGRVAKVAPTDSTVLVTGETGTGKELIARAIHKRSRRAHLRERQLRRRPGPINRVGTVRAREGCVYRRDATPPGPL
jgi:transcriptional regulator with GAF, ATPase, and Fis domain